MALQDLAAQTDASFTLEYNPHKSSYEDAKKYIGDINSLNDGSFYDEVGTVDYSQDIWTIQVYPRTPVGFIAGVSNNLDELVAWATDGAREY